MAASPTFELDLLRTFVLVVQCGTFAAAGKRLQLTQSAVSQQMQRLEAQLGQTLFQRQGRGKLLTDYGRHLLRYAQEMLALNDDAMLALRAVDAGGVLRIGSPHDIADSLLTDLLSHTVRYMPGTQLDIRIGRSPELMQALHRGELDLTLSNRREDSLEGFALQRSPTVWLCASTYVHVPAQPLPLILGDEPSVFRRYALQALERDRVAWRQVFTSASPIGIKSAVRAGLGVTARSMQWMSEDMRVLGVKEGMPVLPDIVYYLWIRPSSVNAQARQAFDLLRSTRMAQASFSDPA